MPVGTFGGAVACQKVRDRSNNSLKSDTVSGLRPATAPLSSNVRKILDKQQPSPNVIIHLIHKPRKGIMKKKSLVVIYATLFSINAMAAEIEVTPEQERDFLAKRGTIVYAPVDLNIKNKKTILLSGVKNAQNHCIIQNQESISSASELPQGYSLITIELAHNQLSCESLVYKGIVPSNIRQAPPSTPKKNKANEQIPESSDGNKINQSSTINTLPMIQYGSSSTSPTAEISSTARMAAVAHTVWTDGNHPIMQAINYEIEVNSIRNEITAPYNFCSGGAFFTASNEPYELWLTGWSLDPSSTWNYGHNCSVSPGIAFVGANAMFSNTIFPGCSPGVYTNYQPNAVTIKSVGGATWNQNIYKSGVIQGCGEYLRFYFLNSYQ